jgi:hypothetical protein
VHESPWASRYPNIDIYVPHQAAADLHDAGIYDHVLDSGIDGDALHEKTQAAISAADHVDGYHFPWLSPFVPPPWREFLPTH